MSTREALEAVLPQAKAGRVVAVVLAALAGLSLVAFGAWWLFVRPHQALQDAKQAQLDSGIARGAAAAGADAVVITHRVDLERRAIDARTEENDNAIKSAAGADQPVDPAVFAALHDALCLRNAYQSASDCAALRGAGGRVGPAGADAGGGPADTPVGR